MTDIFMKSKEASVMWSRMVGGKKLEKLKEL